LFNISVLLDVQANLPETSPFFVCPNGFGEHLFQMFIVLGMYNFGSRSNTSSPLAEVMIPAYPDPTELILDDGNDIGSGSVCFDFCSTNVVQLSMLSKVA
jgi:hypothetical protein